jgi:ribosomal protein S3
VKGRLNGRPRARSRVIKIAKNISVLTMDFNINYSEATAFTPNGTFGIKVWIHEFST